MSGMVWKYLPESTVTTKGHMNGQQKTQDPQQNNMQLTTVQSNAVLRPITNKKTVFELFIGATFAEQNNGTIYMDKKRKFSSTIFSWQKMPICIIWIQKQCHPGHSTEKSNSQITSGSFQRCIQLFRCKRIQTKVKCDGQSMRLNNSKLHHIHRCKNKIGEPCQSLCKCSRKSNADMEESLDIWHGHIRSQLEETSLTTQEN